MFRDLMRLQDRMNRMFEETFPVRREDDDLFTRGNWAPAVDIYEKDNSIVLKADIPDVDPKDIDIRVEGNRLYLKGERRFEKETKEENFHRLERSYGSFARSFAFPYQISADKIEAKYQNGVLHVTLPKREDAMPKKIKISAAGPEERRFEPEMRNR